ncbi:Protein CBR-EGO-2 [Caenorhabditis briggsae]|uniref:Protein CBR-EGO-2 n=1 Tax=Caenorhabditis briggsae TaxID=6238 RepID=A8WXE7_CAEBR|nr:Protein CBR-EGO-2 [Caenorhabditis briggsae]CAP25097.2 Protein CBR-EGO-2 [Caenorhabditis briggsae]
MEALPTLPLMAPQFRTSTLSYDNIPNFDFKLRMKEYILLTFNADPHEYDSAFEELTQMKFEATIPDASPEQAQKLKKYYSQLCMMQKRFPMGAGEIMETPFAWHDGLIDMRSAHSEVQICDIEFEKASVMFNIGTCHAQVAAKEMRETQESIKTAFSHLQQATLAFEQLNTFRNSDFFYPSVDLDANVISFYYKVLLAQCQECLVQKSLLENRSPILIAKLCLWIQEAYDSATKIVDDWSINIPESVQRYYSKLCQMKSDVYGVIGYMSMGDHSEKEDKKMGWRLQYYNIANKYMEQLTHNSAKMRDRYPEMFATYSFLFDVISAKQKNAEKENDFIYHDRVPKQEDAMDTARKDGVRCIVDLKKVQFLDAAGYGIDLFAKLLPSHVQDAQKKYAEMKDEILREMNEIVKSYDEHLNYNLQLADFDRLRFMLSNGKDKEAWFEIPEDLMRRNADMTAFPDCVPNLIEKMRESSDTARVAEAKLMTLLSKLRAIDLPRFKADEGFNLIQKELERLAEHLEQAKANNVSLNKAIAQHSANLQILTLPCVEMWQKIVPDDDETGKNKSGQSDQEKRIREMVNKVLEMMDQRKTLMSQLEASLKADDISSKIIGTNEKGAEQIMHTELEKHSDAQKYIRLNATAQDAILRAFTDANADFFEERTEMSEKRKAYEQRVAELCASYEVYKDVQRKVAEGEQFYRQLMARCDQFAIPVHAMEEQYREEMDKKEKAKKEAEHHMRQLRMSRDAQNALMDFGGGGASSYVGGANPPIPRGGGGGAGPRLGDFMDSYRARKHNQTPQNVDTVDQAPPSPTPSSICDFPVAQRSKFGPASPSSAHFRPGSPFGPSGGPQMPPSGPPGPRYQYSPAQAPPTGYAQQPYPLPPGAPPSSYQVPRQQAPPTYPGGQQAPPTQASPTPYGQAPPTQAPPTPYGQAPPLHYGPSPVQQGGGYQAPPTVGNLGQQVPPPSSYPGYESGPQAPPTSQQAPPSSGYPGYSPSPVQGGPAPPTFQNQQAPPPSGYSGYAPSPIQRQQAPPTNPSTPASGFQAPPTFGNQASPPSGYSGYAPSPVQDQQAPHTQQAPPPSGYNPSPIPGRSAPPTFGNLGHQAPPPFQNQQAPPTFQNQAAQFRQGPPANPFTPGSGFQAPLPPQYPSYQQAPPPAQPTYQHAPQATPISAPPPSTTVHQHVAGAATVTPATTTKFQPTAGAPSPWHATPVELKPKNPIFQTPWATQPQYHAPTTTSTASGAPGAPQTSSNVDLLSDLLGDFNMTPSIQPTMPAVQNQQHFQQQQQQQQQQSQAPPPFPQAPPTQIASNQSSVFQSAPHPTELPSSSKLAFVRPAAAVQPMPQNPQQQQQTTVIPDLAQIAQQNANSALETPILIKGESTSITELSDPSKFELGQGNVQKLEKRMLHQSFRTNGPPPPLNPSDPLNQIDAFGSFK